MTLIGRIARGVLDDLLKDLSIRPEFSNWEGRDESVVPPTGVLKTNPRNLELDQKRASLEARIQRYDSCTTNDWGEMQTEYRLQEEKDVWQSVQKSPLDQHQLLSDDTITSNKIRFPSFELLDAEEDRIHKYIAAELEPLASVSARTTSRLQGVQRTSSLTSTNSPTMCTSCSSVWRSRAARPMSCCARRRRG